MIAILPTGVGKCTIFTVYAFTKISWELFCSPWQKNTKQLLNWHLLLHCKPAKSIINNSRSDWFSKANTLVWAEPCARWAELKMLSFWAGGISSFPPCTREYRLLRRLSHTAGRPHQAFAFFCSSSVQLLCGQARKMVQLVGMLASQIQIHIMIHKLIHIFHAYW